MTILSIICLILVFYLVFKAQSSVSDMNDTAKMLLSGESRSQLSFAELLGHESFFDFEDFTSTNCKEENIGDSSLTRIVVENQNCASEFFLYIKNTQFERFVPITATMTHLQVTIKPHMDAYIYKKKGASHIYGANAQTIAKLESTNSLTDYHYVHYSTSETIWIPTKVASSYYIVEHFDAIFHTIETQTTSLLSAYLQTPASEVIEQNRDQLITRVKEELRNPSLDIQIVLDEIRVTTEYAVIVYRIPYYYPHETPLI